MRATMLTGPRLPSRLKDLDDPPTALFVHGRWPLGPVVSVVGTRLASEEGARFTRGLCRELARAGVVVASGGAAGIDTAAHAGALEGGATLVVAPAGFLRPFPERNLELFRRVAEEGGAYVSECAPDQPALRHVFFRRNSLLVALSDLVVVAESPFRSGARNAAWWARKLGRPLGVVPHSPWNARGGGWLEEHRLGAALIGGHRDVLALLERLNLHALGGSGSAGSRQLELGLAPALPESATALDAIVAKLGAGPVHIDDLVAQTGLSAQVVQTTVTELCLDDRVTMTALGVVGLRGAKALPTGETPG